MDAGVHTVAATSVLRREHAYDELKRRLLTGDFPLNLRLGEERLAVLLGVSRTPVREALLRLHAEGLIGPHPEGGFRPVAPAVDEVHDLYEVRMALELQALRRPAEHDSTHDLPALVVLQGEWLVLAGQRPEPDPGFVILDEDFHVRLAAASGNPSLADLLRIVNERIRVVRMHDFLTAERVGRTITQHLEILEAVLDGDLPLAVARFGRHLGESMAVVEERAAQALARMVSSPRPMPPNRPPHPEEARP